MKKILIALCALLIVSCSTTSYKIDTTDDLDKQFQELNEQTTFTPSPIPDELTDEPIQFVNSDQPFIEESKPVRFTSTQKINTANIISNKKAGTVKETPVIINSGGERSYTDSIRQYKYQVAAAENKYNLLFIISAIQSLTIAILIYLNTKKK